MVYVLLGTGFEETEAITPIDLLRRAGIQVMTVGVNGSTVVGGHGIGVVADITVDEMDLTAMDMIVLPGGLGGVHSILASETAMNAVKWAYENEKYVAAICAAPSILAKLGITDGKKAVVYPGMEPEMGSALMQDADAVRDGKVLTGRGPGAAMDFGLMLLETLKDAETAAGVQAGMVYHH